MLKEYKFQSWIGVWGGAFFMTLGAWILRYPQESYLFFAWVIIGAGYLLFSCGCLMYAKGKGYAWWMGLLGFFLGPLGLLLLYLLKDKSKMVLKMRRKQGLT